MLKRPKFCAAFTQRVMARRIISAIRVSESAGENTRWQRKIMSEMLGQDMTCVVRRYFLFHRMMVLMLVGASILGAHGLRAAPGFVLQDPPKIDRWDHLNAAALCQLSRNTLAYFKRGQNQPISDAPVLNAGAMFAEQPEVTLARVQATLDFTCRGVNQNQALEPDNNKQLKAAHLVKSDEFASLIKTPELLAQYFDFYRWYPDTDTAQQHAHRSDIQGKKNILNAIPDDQILLTKYYTKLLNGSLVKTSKYTKALYALPHDEQGLTKAQAAQQPNLTRYRYTRQQVLAGVLDEKSLAQPLVWLTEAAVHDVLLQGTGIIEVDGQLHYFNVHRNNGIAYDYAKGKTEQARYWYFSEVSGILGYGQQQDQKIEITPQLTVAGNIPDLGLGKLFLLSYPQDGLQVGRLAVLADEGGAFKDNRFQLDLLVDSYYGWDDYHRDNKHLPDFVGAWMLLLKSEPEADEILLP